MVKNYLVCEAEFPAEGGWIGNIPDQEQPAEYELATFIHQQLELRTTKLSEIWNEESYGWSFNCDHNGITINVLIQRIDYWLITCSIVSLMPNFLRSEKYNETLLEICSAIDHEIHKDSRFTNIQWLTADEHLQFDKDFRES
jgi:hypothetical protein